MGVRVKIADTREELESLFRCRHRVYVEQGKFMPPRDDGMVFDAYDAWPPDDCMNFIALDGDEVIGGIRMLRRSDGRGTSADEMFDFVPHFQPDTVRASGSMLCVDQRYRRHERLTNSLFSMFYHYAWVLGIDEVYACITPKMWPVCQVIGGVALAPIPQYSDQGLPYVPFRFWVRDLVHADRWIHFVKEHSLEEFLGVWDRTFFQAGEVVCQAGTVPDAAFVIVSGEAEVHVAADRVVRLFRPYMFGEEELLSGALRTHDVVARTDLDLVVLDRATFFERVAAQPQGAFKYARALIQQPTSVERRPVQGAQSETPALPPFGVGAQSRQDIGGVGVGMGGQRPLASQRKDSA